ncbi:hypothetical protein QF13_000146 [Salmonella enterica subsp. enterica]|uniref:hypothetical protein n=1 Tax=Salmonella enterica TaxID=28901 RepID=UPI0009B03C99|nr:hypothetical protein [Salmonella enterica]EBG0214450.1 hypothetical protein [Salmonella enterica subsp. enterica serovar Louisiana]EBR8050190.1 hypothetical protein [Salmonella enterica subsp. enterica serovar Altona]EBW2268845.1 hypothetical protein [Salmonella enterica subsp. enterica serovar Hillingdon]ECG2647956.1 hypothetical protein [Salmonella enterica subsp. enterica serovar Chailey]EDY8451151.1 hypothetical protein [Salmonella enterica subsp. enterica serovar Wangata]EEJ6521227.1 
MRYIFAFLLMTIGLNATATEIFYSPEDMKDKIIEYAKKHPSMAGAKDIERLTLEKMNKDSPTDPVNCSYPKQNEDRDLYSSKIGELCLQMIYNPIEKKGVLISAIQYDNEDDPMLSSATDEYRSLIYAMAYSIDPSIKSDNRNNTKFKFYMAGREFGEGKDFIVINDIIYSYSIKKGVRMFFIAGANTSPQ